MFDFENYEHIGLLITINKKELEYYTKYCEIFETSWNEDLTEYIKARAKETEKYLAKNKKERV